ncbi:MAG: hypothetical protein ACNA8W_15645 [Bradymonadaceae bacterium]
MSTRFQAQIKPTTLETLETLRERLGLEPSDRAGLLDALAGLAAWSIEQASRGCHIVATESLTSVSGEEHLDPVLQRLRRDARGVEVQSIMLSDEEALSLQELMTESTELNEDFVNSLRRTLAADRLIPEVHWQE